MQSPLHRLYKTKLVLASFIGTVAGYLVMAIGKRIDSLSGFGFLKALDLYDIGIVLMTSFLIVVLFTYLGNEETKRDDRQRTREAVRAEAPSFVEAVVGAMAHTPDEILTITSPEVLDSVIENALAARVHNRELAADAYANLRDQIIEGDAPRRDVRVDVTLAPWERGGTPPERPMFLATIRWTFRMTPSSSMMRFSCSSDLDELSEIRRDPSSMTAWYFEPVNGLNAASAEAFELVQVTVDGKRRPIRRATRTAGQTYTVGLGEGKQGREVEVAYTIRTLVQRSSHFLELVISQPTKGFTAQLSYGGCGIRHVNVMNYVANAKQPRVSKSPANDPAPVAEVRFDGWIFPKGGVVFGWVLDSEVAGRRPR